MTSAGDPGRATDRPPLDRGRVVRAGIALADASGVKGLSMRTLAKALGFEVMSLYNHVANKADLLAAMVDAVADEVADPDPGLEPLERVRALVVDHRAVLEAHPWATPLWQGSLPGPGRVRLMENLLAALADSSLDDETAHHGYHAVVNHVLGYTLQAQTLTMGGDADEVAATIDRFLGQLDPERHRHSIAHVHQHLAGDTGPSFELVLDLILEGLERRSPDR